MQNSPPGSQPWGETIGKLMGLPSPEKILGELQRLNNNLEILQPDINRLSKSMEGMSAADLRNLSAALGNLRAGDMMRMLNEFTHLGNQIYEKLWGKK